MARTVLTVIGLLVVVGAGAVFMVPGDEATPAKADPAQTTPASKLYTSLLEQATVKVAARVPARGSNLVATADPHQGLSGVATPAVAPPSLDSTASLSTPTQPISQSAVGASAVNVRASANSGAAIVGVLQPRQAVDTGTTVAGWTEVSLPDGRQGWVYGRYLTSAGAAPTATALADPNAPSPKVSSVAKRNPLVDRRARLGSSFAGRAGPSLSSPIIGVLEAGSSVRILEARGAWLHLLAPDGTAAWIKRG